MRKGEISQELYDALDKAIESVCDVIQKEDAHSDEYGYTDKVLNTLRVRALAELVGARAELQIVEGSPFEAGTSRKRDKGW